MSKYIFYPGCAMETSARAYNESLMAIHEVLGIELEEVRDWTGTAIVIGSVGRNSLFVFLLQEHVYVSWLWLIDPPVTVLWPLILLLSILVVIALTLVWDRINGMRYLTVGYGRIWGPTDYRAVDSKSQADRRR